MEAQAANENVTVWCNDGNVLKLDFIRLNDLATTLEHWDRLANAGGAKLGSSRFAFSSEDAPLTRAFSNFPARMSSMVSNNSATRAV